jgi:hypothetical protein
VIPNEPTNPDLGVEGRHYPSHWERMGGRGPDDLSDEELVSRFGACRIDFTLKAGELTDTVPAGEAAAVKRKWRKALTDRPKELRAKIEDMECAFERAAIREHGGG